MKKLPISVCLISGAEAQRIGQALASVADWTSQIVVVLNEEVHDGTDEIARQHGATVFRERWKGFVGQKNSAVEKAAQPWILGLDADEVVSSRLRDEIGQVFEQGSPPFSGYTVPRCSFYFGRWIRHGDWYPDRCLRLWQRGKGRWTGIDPHAKPQVEGPVGKLRQDLLHYTAETFDHQIIKTVAYADDFVRHCAASGREIHFVEMLARPLWRFWRAYVFRLGFLDGWQGYSIAWLASFYTFLRYAKAREAQLKQPQPT